MKGIPRKALSLIQLWNKGSFHDKIDDFEPFKVFKTSRFPSRINPKLTRQRRFNINLFLRLDLNGVLELKESRIVDVVSEKRGLRLGVFRLSSKHGSTKKNFITCQTSQTYGRLPYGMTNIQDSRYAKIWYV